MPRHLISDAYEWINEIPSVPSSALNHSRKVKGGVDATWENKREWNLGCHKCILLHLGLQGDVRSRGYSGGVRREYL
jgi:hypothetical protein